MQSKIKLVVLFSIFLLIISGVAPTTIADNDEARITSLSLYNVSSNNRYARVSAKFKGQWGNPWDGIMDKLFGTNKLEFFYDYKTYKEAFPWDEEIQEQLTFYRRVTPSSSGNGYDVYFSETEETYENVSQERMYDLIFNLRGVGPRVDGLQGETIYVKMRARVNFQGLLHGGSYSTDWKESDHKYVD